MKVSIITPVLNSENTIGDCIKSIAGQSYGDIEHVIVDGGSTDGTIGIIKKYETRISRWVSEPDRGIYDAMNKGIEFAAGEIIGILNSDDMYEDEHVIDRMVTCLEKTGADSCYGDLVYVRRDDVRKPVRCWRSGAYKRERFRRGWMPPHPTFFVRQSIYEKYGLFNLGFPLAADYELMLRFLYRYEVSTVYIPKVMVRMRTGGSCRPGLGNTIHNMKENYQAWQVNSLKTNPLTFLLKPLLKILQYRDRKPWSAPILI